MTLIKIGTPQEAIKPSRSQQFRRHRRASALLMSHAVIPKIWDSELPAEHAHTLRHESGMDAPRNRSDRLGRCRDDESCRSG